MRTTFDISDALLAELRLRAAETRKPLRVVIEEALQIGLAERGSGKEQAVKVRSYPVGIKAAYRGVSMNQLYDQLETEDNLRVAEE